MATRLAAATEYATLRSALVLHRRRLFHHGVLHLPRHHGRLFILLRLLYSSCTSFLQTIERRFHLHSTESGMIVTMYDCAGAVVALWVCYQGEKGHKGRWIALGTALFTLGSFLVPLPHFFSDWKPPTTETEASTATSTVCHSTIHHGSTGEETTALAAVERAGDGGGERGWFYFLLFAQMLRGLGMSPMGTLGVSFLDENVPPQDSPFYLGRRVAFERVRGMEVNLQQSRVQWESSEWQQAMSSEVFCSTSTPTLTGRRLGLSVSLSVSLSV